MLIGVERFSSVRVQMASSYLSNAPVAVFVLTAKQSTPLKTPIDVVNAACRDVELRSKTKSPRLDGPQKQAAAIDLIRNSTQILRNENVISEATRSEIETWLAQAGAIENVINSVIAIWNQFKTTSLFSKLKKCCCTSRCCGAK